MSRDPRSDETILEFLHPKLGKLRRTDFNLKKSNIYRLLNLKKKKKIVAGADIIKVALPSSKSALISAMMTQYIT